MTWQRIIILFFLLSLIISGQTIAQEIEVRKASINRPESSEVAPLLHDSVLYFISNRRTNFMVTYIDQNDELLYHVFRAPLESSGSLGKPKLFAPRHQPRFNAGPLTFSANGATMIATHNLENTIRGSKEQSNRLGLYTTQKRNKGWQEYRQMPFNQPREHSIGHPSLSRDGQLLFFVSDMEGGYGSTDIYFCRREGSEWSEPQNLGPSVNTSGKELFPYIHPTGKLYFTSDGHDGPGGFNIFYINWSEENATPVAMPSPINSIYNDFSCFIADDEQWGYFTSDRDGSDDIFEFSMPQIACSEPKEVVEDNYCFTLYEDSPFNTDTLPYVYRWDFGDGETGKGLEVDHCFPGPGDYQINLHVIDSVLNEELFSVASYNLSLERTKQIWFEAPDTVATGETINMSATIRGFKEIPEEPDFYWDINNKETRIGKEIAYRFNQPGHFRIICSTVLNNNQEVCFYRDITVIDPQE